MSALSVVWVARERLVRLENHDDDECTKLVGELEQEMKGEIEIKKAYDLDDQAEDYYLRHCRTGSNPDAGGSKKKEASKKGPANEMILSRIHEEGSGGDQDQTGGLQEPPQQGTKNRFTRFQDGAKNFKRLFSTKNKPPEAPGEYSGKPKGNTSTSEVADLNQGGKQDSGDPKGDNAHESTADQTCQSTKKDDRSEEASRVLAAAASPGTASQAASLIISTATDFLSDVSIPQEKLVGMMKEHIQQMEDILLDNNGNKFIWICGTKNGVGKTTLARELYDKSPKLLQHFDGRAWASIGEKYQARDVADSILLQLSYAAIHDKDIKAMAATEMMELLEETQHGRRCLLVLDDVPSVEAWKAIQSTLPLYKDTRIVITACWRQEDLEILENANTKKILREPLKDGPTWELLENQLSKEDRSVAKDEKWKGSMEILKQKIFRRCQGSPLATTVLGGMLRGKLEKMLQEETGDLFNWLSNASSPSGDQPADKSLQELLSLCYNQLPFLLKSCFLYLGIFSDDHVIPVGKLYLMWISEGIIPEREGKRETRMVTAEKYLKALAQRGLVVLQEEDTPSLFKVKSCELHPQVRKICIMEGQKDGFIRLEKQTTAKGDKENSQLPTKRKIAISQERLQDIVMKHHRNEARLVRALLFFKGSFVKETVEHLKNFELARLLDFDGVDFLSGVSLKIIDQLIHLRHLSFRGSNLKEFPPSFKVLSVLETLDLLIESSDTPVTVPDDLGEMSSLLHLYLPLSFKTADAKTKLKLHELTKLEILENFHAGKCEVGALELLKELRIFTGVADGYNKDVTDMVKYVNETTHLCNSALSLKHFDIYGIDTSETVKRLLSTDSLLALDIEGYVGMIPKITKSIDSVRITKIVFNGTEFETDPMLILGQFPHLRDLILCNDAYLGPEMKCCERNFLKLQTLELSNLWGWEKLNVESGALPSLSSLVIKHCRKLKICRSDLKKMPTLREIMIDLEIRD